ncbi:MAG: hypothetical protein HY927_06985 [Elusimicrobia bacterium]|nr:hypothetical protein [Elusimicrobiota bacterium]
MLRRLVLFLGVVAAGILPAGGATGRLPAVRLKTLTGFQGPALDSCSPRKRCVTVYVSPGCGYCRSAVPTLRRMRDELRFKGVGVRFVVGGGTAPDIRRFAEKFGSDTLLDVKGLVPVSGYPTLWVTDRRGVVLRTRQGASEKAERLAAWAVAP